METGFAARQVRLLPVNMDRDNCPRVRPLHPPFPFAHPSGHLPSSAAAPQDLLLFGEAVEQEGADRQAADDMWIGLDTAEQPGAAAAAGEGPPPTSS